MKFSPKSCILKSDKSVLIRVPKFEEAQQLLDLKRDYIKNTSTIPMHLEEYPNDIDKESSLIAAYDESPNSILLVAEFGNQLIGNIDLIGSKKSKMSHTAMLGMGIKKDWRNQGLGKHLIEAVIAWAKEKSELEIIYLDVYA